MNDGTQSPYICLCRRHWNLWRLPLEGPSNRAFINGSESEVTENEGRIAVTIGSWRAKEYVFRLDVSVDDCLPFARRWRTTKSSTVVSVMYISQCLAEL